MQKVQEAAPKVQVASQTPNPSTQNATPLPFAVSKSEIINEQEVTMSPALQRSFQKNSGNVSNMSEDDIKEYARFIIRQQLAVPLDDMKRQFARELGYSRRNKQTDLALELAVATLIDSGELTEKDGNITSVAES